MTGDAFDFTPCRDCACSAARKASRAITQHFDAHLRGSGLRATQFTVLATLAQTGPMPMTRLAAFIGLERTTLTRNLKALLRDGLVEACEATDGRVRRIANTKKGESAARDAFPLWRRAQDSVEQASATHGGRRANDG